MAPHISTPFYEYYKDILALLYSFIYLVSHCAELIVKIIQLERMTESRGTNCVVAGCSKRKKKKEGEGETVVRSDSEGSEDEESTVKRWFPRTFHR